MPELTVNSDYLEIGSEEWLDDFSEISETWTNAFQAYADMVGGYVSSAMVKDWAGSLGDATGIYGEDGPVTVSTVNCDSWLSSDITFTFLHLSAIRTDDVGEDEEWQHTLIVTHGSGYMLSTANWCEVREFNGDDDGDAFGYDSGYAVHATKDCGADWILENAFRMWRNGGRGNNPDISDCILPTEDGDAYALVCPDCGDTLIPYTR